MADLTRAEREQLIDRDDGDLDTTVYLLIARSSQARRYHADPDCSWIKRPDELHERTRRQAQNATRPPCTYCVLDGHDRSGDRGVDCPYCPKSDVELATHLPCDETPTAKEAADGG